MQAIPCFEDVKLFVEAKSTNKKTVKVRWCWFEGQGMVVQGVFLVVIFFLNSKHLRTAKQLVPM